MIPVYIAFLLLYMPAELYEPIFKGVRFKPNKKVVGKCEKNLNISKQPNIKGDDGQDKTPLPK